MIDESSATRHIHDAIKAYLRDHRDVVSQVAAKDLIENVLPADMVQAWLWERRHEIMAALITHISRAQGTRAAKERRHEIFAEAAERLSEIVEDGDEDAKGEFFKMWHCGNKDGQPVRKRLGDMNRDEVEFHTNRQRSNIRYYQRRVRFLELVAERLGAGEVVGDQFAPDELETLLASIT